MSHNETMKVIKISLTIYNIVSWIGLYLKLKRNTREFDRKDI